MNKQVLLIFTAISIGAITFNACKKSEEQKPIDPYDQQKKECALKEEHKSTQDSIYVWEGNQCIGKFIGIQKEDKTIEFNLPGVNGGNGVPPYSDLDSITHLSHIADVYLKFAQEKQFGEVNPSPAVFNRCVDSLKAYSDRNTKIKIVGGKVYTTFDSADFPQFNLVEKFENLGIELLMWTGEKSIGKDGKSKKAHNKEVVSTGKGTLTGSDKQIYAAGRRWARQQQKTYGA